ncbi:capsular polysaccharide export protein [Albimonas donghaensis]|uniref:Capsular polysaccharide export protein n=1 Tax=Albimonas donghaensis TaxID=356660 RepID=A0A1H2WSB4_9RHOB|nr:capsular biosynthesis protein [Albimonas donghaensis]SDW83563.1 capsular polysaccharide export protein [Albimonas donghaensis]
MGSQAETQIAEGPSDGPPDGTPPRAPRRALFLQGPPTVFWTELAAEFEAQGHATLRVNLSTADRLMWRRPGAADYRGTLSGWRAWIAAHLERERITDVLYYADRLPYHVIAAEEADRLGIPCHAVEFGYLRPDWLTLERRGMGAFSHFPDDPDAIRAIAAAARAQETDAELETRHGHSFVREARDELLFNLANALFCWPYPFYQMDKRYHALTDYVGWIPKLLRVGARDRHAEKVEARYLSGEAPFHLVALQVESDYQLRDNAPYDSLREAIDQIVASFARHAGPAQRLLFKLHPLDNGLENWPRAVARAAAAHGLGDRVDHIDGGALDALIAQAEGVVSVNSTVGLHAIRALRPTLALGAAVYDMPGLTHQGPLARFWTAPEPVDPQLAEDFALALAASAQVKGSFYEPTGRARAKAEIVARVAEGRVNALGAFVPVPPRLPVRPREADLTGA